MSRERLPPVHGYRSYTIRRKNSKISKLLFFGYTQSILRIFSPLTDCIRIYLLIRSLQNRNLPVINLELTGFINLLIFSTLTDVLFDDCKTILPLFIWKLPFNFNNFATTSFIEFANMKNLRQILITNSIRQPGEQTMPVTICVYQNLVLATVENQLIAQL